MGPVSLRLRKELRSRRGSFIALTMIAGLLGGLPLAMAAGAHRTSTVMPRLIERTRPPDVYVAPPNFIGEGAVSPSVAELKTIDVVRDVFVAKLVNVEEHLDVNAIDAPQETIASIARVLAGRLPNFSDPSEAAINFLAAERLHLHPGSTITLHTRRGTPPDDHEGGPTLSFRITGVLASAGDFGVVSAAGVNLSPLVLRSHPEISTADLKMVSLRRGPADVPAFRTGFQRIVNGKPSLFIEGTNAYSQGDRSFRLQGLALWLLAGAVAIFSALAFGQALGREIFVGSVDYPTLRALGMSRVQLIAVGMIRAMILGVIAAIVSVGIALALSGFTPIGTARLAEPAPGFRFDAGFLALGALLVVGLVVALAIVPSIRAAHSATNVQGSVLHRIRTRPSILARAISSALPGPSARFGTYLALDRGSGRTTVPVRTTIAATTIGIGALVMALVTGASLTHFLDTPRLYGWNWSVAVAVNEKGADGSATRTLQKLPGVGSFALSTSGVIEVNGVQTSGFVIDSPSDAITLPSLDGRYPKGGDEIALARKTMRALGMKIGDVVEAKIQGVKTGARARIVGIVVVPTNGDEAALGEGALMPVELTKKVFPDGQLDTALVRFAPGADVNGTMASLRKAFGDDSVQFSTPPSTVIDFGRVKNMPLALAVSMGLLAIGALAHGLATTTRRRRRDIAVLRVIGFARKQIGGALSWQTAIVVLTALLLGIPGGIAAGRLLWRLFADQNGFVAEPAIAIKPIALGMAAVVVTATAVALVASWTGARMRPAEALRTE